MALSEPLTTTPRTDLKHCRRLLRSGSRSFFAASLLLPQPTRDAAISLYAFCRLADDAIDDSKDPDQALQRLHQRVDAIYAERPANFPADRALAVVVRQYGIPRALVEALLEGFAWDCQGRVYPDLSALRQYAARVAGTVGVMMTLLMGRREPGILARAADLGVAMQLTNIARDVGEDARRGRLYLPADWFHSRSLCTEAFLAEPRADAPVAEMLEVLLLEADALYRRADAGIAQLPTACRPCVMTARLLYSEIGEEVRRNGFDAISRRAVVSPGRKWLTMTQLTRGYSRNDELLAHPPLEETRFLVTAVEASPLPESTSQQQPGKLEWTLDLFATLERREGVRRENAFS